MKAKQAVKAAILKEAASILHELAIEALAAELEEKDDSDYQQR